MITFSEAVLSAVLLTVLSTVLSAGTVLSSFSTLSNVGGYGFVGCSFADVGCSFVVELPSAFVLPSAFMLPSASSYYSYSESFLTSITF